MKKYLHRVIGIYADETLANSAQEQLRTLGFEPDRIRLLKPHAGAPGAASATRADSDDVLNEMLREGAVGTAVGAAAGAGGTVALGLANAGLFIANPVLGTLVMLGWGASLGGLIGALDGARNSKGEIADLIRDAIASGHVVLVVYADNEARTAIARKVLGDSLHELGLVPPGTATAA